MKPGSKIRFQLLLGIPLPVSLMSIITYFVVGGDLYVDPAVTLQGVERVFDEVLHDPFEQRGVDLGFDRRDSQAVIVDHYVAGVPACGSPSPIR